MHRIRLSWRPVLSACVLIAPVILAAAGSTYYDHGRAIALTDSYACTEPDMLNAGRLVTIVAFANGTFAKAPIAAADDPCRELRQQVGTRFTALVELKIKYDGTAYNVQIDDPSGTSSRNDNATLKLTKNDGTRIEGTYVSKDKSKKTSRDSVFFDLSFALDVAHAK